MHRVLAKPKVDIAPVLTDRDVMILRGAYRFRFLSTDQVQKLTKSRSRNNLNERLRTLYLADYLDRPAIQAAYRFADKRPTIHALGPNGAAWLAANDRVRFPKGMSWKHANQIKSVTYLEHQLGITDTYLAFRDSLAELDGYRLIHHDELVEVAPRQAQSSNRPYRLPTEIRLPDGSREARGTYPDLTFAMGRQDPDGERKALFFLEWDNATENYLKTDPRQSSVLQKLLAYADARTRRLHVGLYGIKNFRVLFVVPDEDRIARMQHVYRERVREVCPPGSFLFATMSELEEKGPLGAIWRTAADQATPLVQGEG